MGGIIGYFLKVLTLNLDCFTYFLFPTRMAGIVVYLQFSIIQSIDKDKRQKSYTHERLISTAYGTLSSLEKKRGDEVGFHFLLLSLRAAK